MVGKVKINIIDDKPRRTVGDLDTDALNATCEKVTDIIALECRNLGQMISVAMAVTNYICTTSLECADDPSECEIGLQCIEGGLRNMIDQIKENSVHIIAKKMQEKKWTKKKEFNCVTK